MARYSPSLRRPTRKSFYCWRCDPLAPSTDGTTDWLGWPASVCKLRSQVEPFGKSKLFRMMAIAIVPICPIRCFSGASQESVCLTDGRYAPLGFPVHGRHCGLTVIEASMGDGTDA